MSTKILPIGRDWLIHKGDIIAPITETGFMKAGVWKMNGASQTLDESGWQKVNLPHDFVIEGDFCRSRDRFIGNSSDIPAMEDLDSMHTSRGSLSAGVAWYRHHFTLPEEAKGKRVYLRFDGVYRDSTLYVNQYLCRKTLNGYLGFTADVTDLLSDEGDNLIALRVDAKETEGWWYMGGGIYRNVWMIIDEQVHISEDGVQVISDVDYVGKTAELTVAVSAENHTARDVAENARIRVTAPDGTEACEGVLPLTIPAMGKAEERIFLSLSDISLWDCENPNLYRVTVTLESGASAEVNIGLRHIRFDADRGFFLNGKNIKLKGVCVHQGHGGIGTAEFDGMHEYKIQKLKEMGANAYRTSHNPTSPQFLDACDRLGMLVMDETRLLSTGDEDRERFVQMIKRDRNHPSVIMWSIGNEEYNQFTEQARKIARTMVDLAHTLDPTRLTTEAMLFWDRERHLVRDDVEISAPISDNVDIIGINYGLAVWDKLHAMYADKPFVATEIRSSGGTRDVAADDPEACHLAFTSGKMISSILDGSTAWRTVATRDYAAGLFIWTGFDYYGEPTPFKFPAVSTQFGVMDLCGFPKYGYHYYQQYWGEKDVFVLCPHWNPCPFGEKRDVVLFGNCASAELFVNGQSVGIDTAGPYGYFLWKGVTYAEGEITAVGYDGEGNELRRTTVETTGAAIKLEATLDHVSVDENGMKYAIVNLAALDAEGRVVPTAENGVRLVAGEGATLLGSANGDPACTVRATSNVRPLFGGRAQAIFRRDASAPAATLTFSAAGLDTVTVEF